MICKQCNAEIPDEAKFCPGCGAETNTGGRQAIREWDGFPDDTAQGGWQELLDRKRGKRGQIIGGIATVAAVLILVVVGIFTANFAAGENVITGGQSLVDYNDNMQQEREQRQRTYTPGTLTDTMYTNAYFGLRYSPSSSWTLGTQSELEEKFENQKFEMLSVNGSDDFITLAVEQLPVEAMTTEQYIDSLIDSMTGSFTFVDIDRDKTMEICGNTYNFVGVSVVNANGVDVQIDMYVFKKYQNVIVIGAVYRAEDAVSIQEELKQFLPYTTAGQAAE